MSLLPLEPAAAYRLWAPTYDAENAVTSLEDRAVRALTPPLAGKRVLDVACGTGRRLPCAGAQHQPQRVVGIDLVFEMVSRARTRAGALLVVGDMRALPCAARSFDVIWCRLAVGHVPDLQSVYDELARVARHGATVIVTDFHPAAVQAGHTRTFRDEHGRVHDIVHVVHEAGAHTRAATAARLRQMERVDAAVDRSVRRFYEDANRLAAFEQQRGLPLVLAHAFRA